MEATLIDRIQARRTELLESHGKLMEQLNQVTVAVERTRGAISICDEMLAKDGATEPVMPNLAGPTGPPASNGDASNA